MLRFLAVDQVDPSGGEIHGKAAMAGCSRLEIGAHLDLFPLRVDSFPRLKNSCRLVLIPVVHLMIPSAFSITVEALVLNSALL